ncbi:RNA-directed DNA polymerase from mobile element jockey [Eumeta japonica]|uniref:RNA-directed DNA polymerase from mobile element jockey n=1 Tax=Eumeta variegata TaxID=151549 RepID=A0A4C1TBY3_EUMVA|nr:RNA-directed DNA polymerase from mobile element jockey [Eumeta japonica]
MVQQTLLKPKNSKACKIKNFTQLRTDRLGALKGGTALYYKRSLYCSPISILPLSNIEATACRLSMTGHGILTLVSVYLPPKKKLLRSDLEVVLFALRDAVILFGNLNSKSTHWNCKYSNRNGRKMVQLTDNLQFDVVTPLTPTHYPSNDNYRPEILDIALMRGIALKVSCIETLQCLSSDHRPVLMSILNDIISTDDVDKATGALTNHVCTVVENSSRVVPANFDPTELPRDVSELIRAKKTALRRASKYPTCENRSHVRALQHKVKAHM